MEWYVANTYVGHECKARTSLCKRIKSHGLANEFGDILIPTESASMRKFYPGYMFVQMNLNESTFHLVTSTPRITGFLGGTHPSPVHESKIAQIITITESKSKPKLSFARGNTVRVIDGPFSSLTGAVEAVKANKQRVRVLLSIFGRTATVEFNFDQVTKLAA